MSACIILVIGLLCSSINCASFKWDPLVTFYWDRRMEDVAHDASADGSIHIFWEMPGIEASSLVYQVFLPNKTVITKAVIKGALKGDRFRNISVQVSADARHVLVVYVREKEYDDYKEGFLEIYQKACFIESLNGGETWTAPVQLDSYRTSYFRHYNPSMVLEKDTGRVYIGYTSSGGNSGRECMPSIAIKEPGSAFFKRKRLTQHYYDSARVTVGSTVEKGNSRQYLHYLLEIKDNYYGNVLQYARSEDNGKTESNFTSLERDVHYDSPNALTTNSEVEEGGVYVMFNDAHNRGTVRKSIHGKEFMGAIQLNGKIKEDSKLTLCGKNGKGILLAVYYDHEGKKLHAAYLPLNTMSFQELPFAFEKVSYEMLKYIGVSCSVVGDSKYSITLLAKTISFYYVYAAHGILTLD